MGLKKNRLNVLFLFMFLVFIILYRIVFITSFLKYAESICAAFLIFMFFLSILFYGFRTPIDSELKKRTVKKVLVAIGIYFLIIYSLGLVTGFLSNSYSLNIKAIFNNIFFQIIIITMIELIRGNFINYNKQNKNIIIIFTVIIILLEVNNIFKISYLKDITSLFKFITVSVLPIIFKNYMCSYLTYYTDFEASLIYSLILGLYKYIVPVEPDLEKMFISIVNIMLPFMVVMNISRDKFNYEVTKENINSKRYVRKSDVPFFISIIILVFLVFGIGPYKIVGIKTGSMTPKLNMGDAVFLDKKVKKTDLKEKDIIAYQSEDGELVVHRIIRINKDGSYITKGDYNNTADVKYVKFKQVKGKVKFKIPYIAYPAVYFWRLRR